MSSDLKRVVVTGATGFIGRRLVRHLAGAGAEVYAFSRHPDHGPEAGGLGLTWHETPRTAREASQAFADIRPHCVFHLAAMFRATHSVQEVENLIEANLSYGVRMAEALQQTCGGVFVNVGTNWQCVSSERYFPACLYAALKQAQEDALQHYAMNGRVRVVNVRLADVYGPFDPRPRLFSLLKQAASPDAAEVELSGGEQLVDLIDVEDVLRGLVQSATAGEDLHEGDSSKVFALSGGRPITVQRLVAIVEDTLGKPLAVRFGARPYRQREMFELWIAGGPPPGWRPTVAPEEGIRTIVVQERW